MSEKRMLIVDVDVMKKIEENRGDLSLSEFFNLLIDNQLKAETSKRNGVSREEFFQFQQGMKNLLHSFLEFFVTYGLELGEQTGDVEFQQLSKRLQSLGGLDVLWLY